MMNKSSCIIKSYHDEMSLFISHNTPYPDTNIAFFVCLFVYYLYGVSPFHILKLICILIFKVCFL